MARYNNGMIYTNDNCIGCNKCIFECPVIGANVSVYENGMNKIVVNEKKCIHCGHCLTTCTHHAREYHDDTDQFFADLAAGRHISLAVAPSFYINYAEKAAGVLGYLRSLGIEKIYDVGYGADIATYCHIQYLEKREKDPDSYKAYVARPCSAVQNYAECCAPDILDYMIPIHSPVVCLGIYVHQYLHENTDIAFLSPCVAKKDEIDAPSAGKHIKYNVTFKHLLEHISHISTEEYFTESDLKPLGMGDLFPIAGGFKEYLEYFTSNRSVILHNEGLTGRHEQLCQSCSRINESGEPPCMIDMLSCQHGCLGGPASGHQDYDVVHMLQGYQKIRVGANQQIFEKSLSVEECKARFKEEFSDLDLSDFNCAFRDRYHQVFSIPESTYDEIFNTMYKYTPAQRSVDCHSCGYSTCRDMVTAIAYGYNRIENCVHYSKDEIARLYYTDPLTGISNKAAFIRDTTELLQKNEGTQYAICVGDINNFTAVNDMYGFEAGNQVLLYLARQATERTKEIGCCARLDTDHYALCFPHDENRLQFFKNTPCFDGNEIQIDFPITMRFGMYLVEDPYGKVDKMLDLAAIAMNQNTDRSRNTYYFYNGDLRKKLLDEANVTLHMREALKNEEFCIYLQPQYNHSTGRQIGAEVLCRWIKPDGDIISPGVFIPIFEKNGFIRELDSYMWDKTFALVHKWLEEKKNPVAISTNISRISLQNENLAEVFWNLSRQYNVEPKRIHLEITESAYMNNQKQIVEIINRLRAYGFVIAMDDFGSGYSSLNTLKSVPVDILKLDMGFLRGENKNDKEDSIISSVVHMAQTLQLETIAEGVETVGQADFLGSVGCDAIQGFLYAKPMPVIEYEALG
ncbi:MAG: EAL domain-containing protein [bacterium]|nr:EAL domain-containing protein [bacterium]